MRSLTITTIISFSLSLLSALAADVWLTDPIVLIGSSIGLTYSLNPGIAWGIRLPSGIQEVLILAALVLVGFLAYKESKEGSTLKSVAYGMILGGGLANIVDRFIDGFVTDYFHIGSFPIFNVADSFVSVGVGVLLIVSMKRS